MSAAVASAPVGAKNDHAHRVDAVTAELISLSKRIKAAALKLLGYLKKGATKLVGGMLRKIQSMRARYKAARRSGKTKGEFVAREVAEVKVRAQSHRKDVRHGEHQVILDEMRHEAATMTLAPVPALVVPVEDATSTEKLIGDAMNTVRSIEFLRNNLAFDLTDAMEVKVARMDAQFVAKVRDYYLSTEALWISLAADEETFFQMDMGWAERMIESHDWVTNLYHTVNPKPVKK